MITLTQPSINILPAFNRINYQIVSTNANEVGFKYVVKVYNSDDELIVTSFYDSPADASDPVEFDVSKFVSTQFDYSKGFYETASSSNSTNIIKGFYLKVYEYYEVGGEFVIVLASEVVSSTKYALAASFPLLELDDWYADVNLYNGVSNTTYKPLTAWDTIKVRETDAQVFGFVNTGFLTNVELIVTYQNGTTQQYFIAKSGTVYPNVNYFKITPMTYGGSIASIQLFVNWDNGTQPQISRYKFATMFTQSCGKHDPMRIAYLNKYGVYDFFNFDLVNKTTLSIERKGYQKNYNGSIYESDGIRVKNINPIYFTKETQNWKIISDYLNDAQSELIRELYSSPLVYLNLVNDNYIRPSWIPVKPNANSYEIKKTASDKLFNLELDLEFGLENNRQVI
jgi:hypothetical protein